MASGETTPADRLLEALRQGGKLHSSGRFTIDPEAARRKLGQYLLPDPELLGLKLVQWAVRSKARQVRVHCAPEELELEHDGELASEFSGFLDSGQIDDLRLAVATAFRLPGCFVEVADGRFCYQLRPGEMVVEPLTSEFKRIRLRWDRWDRTGDQPEEPLGESLLRQIRSAAQHCPLQLSFNGSAAERQVFGADLHDPADPLEVRHLTLSFVATTLSGLHHMAEVRLGVGEDGPVWLGPGRSSRFFLLRDGELVTTARPEAAVWGAGIGLRLNHQACSTILLVARGVIVDHITVDEPSGLSCVVGCESLRLDATGLAPVRNLEFDRLVERTWQLGRRLKDAMKIRPHPGLSESLVATLGFDPEIYYLDGSRRRLPL